MNTNMFQVSTLQALALGYTRSVVKVEELMKHGEYGLGTFEDVNGEMIVIDGKCYRAMEDGTVEQTALDRGVPFATVAYMDGCREFELSGDYAQPIGPCHSRWWADPFAVNPWPRRSTGPLRRDPTPGTEGKRTA